MQKTMVYTLTAGEVLTCVTEWLRIHEFPDLSAQQYLRAMPTPGFPAQVQLEVRVETCGSGDPF